MANTEKRRSRLRILRLLEVTETRRASGVARNASLEKRAPFAARQGGWEVEGVFAAAVFGAGRQWREPNRDRRHSRNSARVERWVCPAALSHWRVVEGPITVSDFAVRIRRLAPWLVLFACLNAAVSPALAREGVHPGAPGRSDLQRDVKESTARYRRAKANADRLAAEIARIEGRLAGVEEQQASLRSLATRGAAALYRRDPTVDWLEGFGDGGEEVLAVARRAKLVNGVGELAGAAVRNLADS